MREKVGLRRAAALIALGTQICWGQGSPAREYFYFGPRLVAIEVRGNATPSDLSYVGPAQQNLRHVSMKFVMTDPEGGANAAQMNVVIGRWYSNMRTCYFYWQKASSTLHLNNGQYGANEQWKAMPLDPSGGVPSVDSDNCKINRTGSSATVNGFNLELTVDVELRAPLGGSLYVWTWGQDASGEGIGWEYLGDYTPQNIGGSGPMIDMLNGSPDSNGNVTFQFHVPDPDGARNMYQLNVVVNSSLSGVGGCFLVVQTLNHEIWLLNGLSPPNEDWITPAISLDSASPQSMESNYCKITTSGSGIAELGPGQNKLVVTVKVQFKGDMWGAGKKVFVWTQDMAGVAFGWQEKATWTIP